MAYADRNEVSRQRGMYDDLDREINGPSEDEESGAGVDVPLTGGIGARGIRGLVL